MKGGNNSYRKYDRPLSNSGIGSGGTSGGNNCDKIKIITNVQMLTINILLYNVGDLLEVVVDSSGNLRLKGDNGDLGIITPIQGSTLKQCINDGKVFGARILELADEFCRVTVQPSG